MWITTKNILNTQKANIKNTFCGYKIGIIFETIKKTVLKSKFQPHED
jgi:hypothetical protein